MEKGDRFMYYKKEKRKEIDLCNICGKSKRLTWDHVPPKCCNNRYAIKTNSWMEGIPEESSYAKKYQNGIKFRSLCDECNNKVFPRFKRTGFSIPCESGMFRCNDSRFQAK